MAAPLKLNYAALIFAGANFVSGHRSQRSKRVSQSQVPFRVTSRRILRITSLKTMKTHENPNRRAENGENAERSVHHCNRLYRVRYREGIIKKPMTLIATTTD